MISDEIFLAISHSCDFEDYTFNNPHNESKSCNDAISEANTIVGEYVNNYDVIYSRCLLPINCDAGATSAKICMLLLHMVQM